MTSRAHTAKKTDTTPAPAPVRKPAAKRTPAARTGRKRTAPRKTTTPAAQALSLVKEQPEPTTVDVRDRLPIRRRHFVGEYTRTQIVEARAALASATARLPIPHILWLAQIDGRAAARLADGTHLVHTHERAPEFTAILRCPTGGLHTEPVTCERDLRAARTITATCTRRHDETDPEGDGYDWHKAATLGVQKLIPARLSPLNAGLQAAKKATADTQPLSKQDIADGLAARAATDAAKEHPQT